MSLGIIFANKGVVFGGYLRDLISGDDPHDIDAVVPEANWDKFKQDMADEGFNMITPLSKYEPSIFEKEGELTVEVIIGEDPPDFEWLGPSADPDFDVNLLAYNGTKMYNWMSLDHDPELDVLIIISSIRKKQTLQFRNAEEDRVNKMKNKGYTIIGFKEDPYN